VRTAGYAAGAMIAGLRPRRLSLSPFGWDVRAPGRGSCVAPTLRSARCRAGALDGKGLGTVDRGTEMRLGETERGEDLADRHRETGMPRSRARGPSQAHGCRSRSGRIARQARSLGMEINDRDTPQAAEFRRLGRAASKTPPRSAGVAQCRGRSRSIQSRQSPSKVEKLESIRWFTSADLAPCALRPHDPPPSSVGLVGLHRRLPRVPRASHNVDCPRAPFNPASPLQKWKNLSRFAGLHIWIQRFGPRDPSPMSTGLVGLPRRLRRVPWARQAVNFPLSHSIRGAPLKSGKT
jgi:hypothetical protein